MKQVVIMPGGFHPFHAGHYALYQQAQKAFPGADVYVAATNDTSSRPFPFAVKQKLAKLAGVDSERFVQVRSPFSAEEITNRYPADETVLIFVKSDKNAKTGSDPEGPFPAEPDPRTGQLPLVTRGPNKGKPVSDRLQYFSGNEQNLRPMSRHSYLAYLPTVKFAAGMSSASEIRKEWPTLNQEGKVALVNSLYPRTKGNAKLTQVVIEMLNLAITGDSSSAAVTENDYEYRPPGLTDRQSMQLRDRLRRSDPFVWLRPRQIGGSFTERELLDRGFKKSQFNTWGGTQSMWNRLLGIDESLDYIDEKISR